MKPNSIDDKIVKDITEATKKILSKIPVPSCGIYYDVELFSKNMIETYLKDEGLPKRYFLGFLKKLKKTTPEELKELELLRREYGAAFWTWPCHYIKRPMKAEQKQ